jgi:outer membrane biosynthesis protein TonB
VRLKVEVREKDRVVFSGEFDEFPIMIGRGTHCHISLPTYGWVSSLHATITGEEDTFLVSDMKSKLGLVGESGKPFLNARFQRNCTFQVRTLIFTVRRLDGVALPEPLKAVLSDETTEPMFVPPLPEKPAPARDHLVSLADSLMLETPPRFQRLNPNQFSLQGVLVWGEDILDVRQFRAGDKIWVGGNVDSPVYLPGIRKPILLGRMNGPRGQLSLTRDINWRLRRQGVDFTPETAKHSQFVRFAGERQVFDVNHGDFVTLDLGNAVSLHLRYVENARFFIRRTWLENREEFVKAMAISVALHTIACLALVITAPKTVAPQIENVPPRFAKLLVEPPPMPLAPPKPEPIPEPVPEPPPPPVVEAKPPEPKPIPKKPEPPPKPVKQVKKTPEKKKPEKVVHKPEPKPVPKAEPKVEPKVVQKQPPTPQPAPEKVAPPKPSASEVAANELMNVFSKVPSPAANSGNKAIKIDRSMASQGPAGQPGLSTVGVSGALKAKGGKLQAGGGISGGVSTAKAGQFGYSNTPGGGSTGKRGVKGGVVGSPKLDDFSSSTNGLTDKEVMSVVNKYLSQVNRCYERALLNDSNLAGRVQYEWDINAEGKVTSVRIKRSEISNGDSLNSCVMLLFKAMKFPAAKNKQPTTATIGFPFGKEG